MNAVIDGHAFYGDLVELLKTYSSLFAQLNPGANVNDSLIALIARYLQIEEVVGAKTFEESVKQLRSMKSTDAFNKVRIYESTHRSNLISSILESFQDLHLASGESWKVTAKENVRRISLLSSARTKELALQAKKMLVTYKIPTYGERYSQVASCLSSAAKSNDHSVVETLVHSSHAILDVLPMFFFSEEDGMRSMALYTYVHHVHKSSEISNEEFQEISGVKFYKCAHRGDTFKNDSSDCTEDITRVLAVVDSLAELQLKFVSLVSSNDGKKPMILQIAMKTDSNVDDAQLEQQFRQLISDSHNCLLRQSISELVFMIIAPKTFPRYFTYRASNRFEEARLIRNVDPAIAFKLELDRLSNFDIVPCFVDNRRMHIYFASAKENSADTRLFVRTLVYPNEVVTENMSSLDVTEFLASEGKQILNDVLDALEIVTESQKNTDCNHLFINFMPVFDLDLESAKTAVQNLVDGHRKRFWKLRVTDGEIRFTIQSHGELEPKFVRFLIANPTGFHTEIEIYVEKLDIDRASTLHSIKVEGSKGKKNGASTQFVYPSKTSIQSKRYKAHVMGTTYVYDFPELFRRAVNKAWRESQKVHLGLGRPKEFVKVTEYALDKCHNLVPVNRPDGLS